MKGSIRTNGKGAINKFYGDMSALIGTDLSDDAKACTNLWQNKIESKNEMTEIESRIRTLEIEKKEAELKVLRSGYQRSEEDSQAFDF